MQSAAGRGPVAAGRSRTRLPSGPIAIRLPGAGLCGSIRLTDSAPAQLPRRRLGRMSRIASRLPAEPGPARVGVEDAVPNGRPADNPPPRSRLRRTLPIHRPWLAGSAGSVQGANRWKLAYPSGLRLPSANPPAREISPLSRLWPRSSSRTGSPSTRNHPEEPVAISSRWRLA